MAARVLGPSGRGELALGVQLSYLVSFLTASGIDRASPRILSGHPYQSALAAAVRASLPQICVLMILGVSSLAAGITLGPGWAAVIGLGLMAAAVGVTERCIRAASITSERSAPVEFMSYAFASLSTGGFLVLTLLGLDRPLLWLAAFVCAAMVPVVAVVLHSVRLEAWQASSDLAAEQRAEVRHNRSGGLAGGIALRGDRIILPPIAGSGELGLYVSVATLSEIALWPVQIGFQVLMPRVHQRRGIARRRLLQASAAAAVLLAISPVGAKALTRLVVPVLGPQYAPAEELVLPLLIVTIAYALATIFLASLLANRAAATRWIEPLVVAAWLPGLYLATSAAGAVGAAWSKAAMYVVLSASLGAFAIRGTKRRRSNA